MPLYDVAFTVTTFKKLPDDSQMKVEKLLGKRDGLVAVSANAAIAVAARGLADDLDDAELANATVIVRTMQ